jgi:hypothetical protein
MVFLEATLPRKTVSYRLNEDHGPEDTVPP